MEEDDELDQWLAKLKADSERKNLANWLINRSIADERSLVEDHARARRIYRRMLAVAIAAMGTLLYVNLSLHYFRGWDGLLSTLAVAAYGVFVGRGIMLTFLRAASYRNGWVKGRSDMLSAMQEARSRGISPDEFVIAEMERTWRTGL